MIQTIYIIILSYFVMGGIGFWFINRNKDRKTACKSRTKFISYFFIIHILFLSIVYEPFIFQLIGLLIVFVGLFELIKLFWQSGFRHQKFWVSALLIYLIFSTGFLYFSRLGNELVLFAFLVLSIFDAFSQISGQLLGKRKLAPSVSPGKTVEGLAGGAVVAVGTSVLLMSLTGTSVAGTLLLAAGITLFAFFGDLAASLFKRKFGVKDFSAFLPGHGGFLDRFDSLITGGALVALLRLTTLI